ncbi:hypothetical protein LY78DRAFT_358066 [Colletotrichum sublineola]|nr:hypothetical protein LY78DRAFT_358066 [Colletotrichum sublineola]
MLTQRYDTKGQTLAQIRKILLTGEKPTTRRQGMVFSWRWNHSAPCRVTSMPSSGMLVKVDLTTIPRAVFVYNLPIYHPASLRDVPTPGFTTKMLRGVTITLSKRAINYRWRYELQRSSGAAPVDMPRGAMILPRAIQASAGILLYLSQLIGRTSKSSPQALPRSISCDPRD